MSHPVHDPIMEVAGKATPRVWHLGAPNPQWPRASLLALRPWLASQARQVPRQRVIDQEPEARVGVVPRLGLVSSSDGAHERT